VNPVQNQLGVAGVRHHDPLGQHRRHPGGIEHHQAWPVLQRFPLRAEGADQFVLHDPGQIVGRLPRRSIIEHGGAEFAATRDRLFGQRVVVHRNEHGRIHDIRRIRPVEQRRFDIRFAGQDGVPALLAEQAGRPQRDVQINVLFQNEVSHRAGIPAAMPGIDHDCGDRLAGKSRNRKHQIGAEPDQAVPPLHRLAVNRRHHGLVGQRRVQHEPDPAGAQIFSRQRPARRQFPPGRHDIGQRHFEAAGGLLRLEHRRQLVAEHVFNVFSRQPVLDRHRSHRPLLQCKQFDLGKRINHRRSRERRRASPAEKGRQARQRK